MRRFALLLALAAAAASSVAFAGGGGSTGVGFRLPDASAACRLDGGALVCRSLAVRAGLALPQRGVPRAVSSRIWWDASTPVLHRWRHGSLACRRSGGAILCSNASGASISVGPRQIAVAL